MELTVNGVRQEIPDVETLDMLMKRLKVSPEARGVAAAINGTVIPRSDWPAARLTEGDEIEIIHAVQGG